MDAVRGIATDVLLVWCILGCMFLVCRTIRFLYAPRAQQEETDEEEQGRPVQPDPKPAAKELNLVETLDYVKYLEESGAKASALEARVAALEAGLKEATTRRPPEL